MFFHNFKYSFKTLFRNKALIFWTFLFPIIMGFFFQMAFKDIEKNETLKVIDIAIVQIDKSKENTFIKQAFSSLSDKKNEDRLFSIKYVTEEKAKELLEKKKIEGYVTLDEEKTKVTVRENGINATVLKYAVDQILETEKRMKDMVSHELQKDASEKNFETIYMKIYSDISKEKQFYIKDISSRHLSYTMIEFYTLLAMACLYGGILGMVTVNQNLANMSSEGKRKSITPISKAKMILGSVLASYSVQLIGVSLLLIFLFFFLKIDFGTNPFLVILLTFIGCLAGLSLGIFIATLLKANENTKTGVILAFTMFGCFLSGMMGITMKYIVDKNVPILNKINPANMITDGFYSLYYYDTLDRYFFNLLCLLIFSFLLLFLSYRVLRRQKYDYI